MHQQQKLLNLPKSAKKIIKRKEAIPILVSTIGRDGEYLVYGCRIKYLIVSLKSLGKRLFPVDAKS